LLGACGIAPAFGGFTGGVAALGDGDGRFLCGHLCFLSILGWCVCLVVDGASLEHQRQRLQQARLARHFIGQALRPQKR
jgi:hypothetical protein